MHNEETSDCRDFLDLRGRVPLIDVRAPIEFSQGHIPGAVNVPLFDDEQRAEVGITYKQRGRREAIRLGLDFIGPRMRPIVDAVESLVGESQGNSERRVLVYCARGGMRSDSICWLLRQADFQPLRLQGGYKRYRQYCHNVFEKDWELVALTGMTGSGKTKLLKLLESAGEQIIDLEGLANHRGSAFGGIGQDEQPSTEQFENLILEELLLSEPDKHIWVEDESRSVGKCVVPSPFFAQLHRAPAVLIELSVKERTDFLVAEYGDLPQEEMVSAIRRISKRLGGQNEKAAIEALENGDLRKCAEILLVYYDKTYEICRVKNPREDVFPVSLSNCEDQTKIDLVLRTHANLSAVSRR